MTEADRRLHIAMGCDEGYRMPLAVMLASVASSLDERYHAVAHVLELGMSDETKSMVERSVPADRMTVRWISVLGDQMAWFQRGLRSYDHFSVASLFRLLLPRLLPPSLDKVIYLDCDMVIRRDLGELWDLDLGNAYLLAVPEQLPAARKPWSSIRVVINVNRCALSGWSKLRLQEAGRPAMSSGSPVCACSASASSRLRCHATRSGAGGSAGA